MSVHCIRDHSDNLEPRLLYRRNPRGQYHLDLVAQRVPTPEILIDECLIDH